MKYREPQRVAPFSIPQSLYPCQFNRNHNTTRLTATPCCIYFGNSPARYLQPSIRAMIDARIAQNLTQKELAERTGIAQTEISRLENGTRNPSIKLLQRLAEGMGMDLNVTFTPKKNV